MIELKGLKIEKIKVIADGEKVDYADYKYRYIIECSDEEGEIFTFELNCLNLDIEELRGV